MPTRREAVVALAAAATGGLAQCGGPPSEEASLARKLAPITDVPGLPRVLVIGDSISIDYTLPVREILASEANIHRVPINAGPTPRGIENVDSWLGDGRWDTIHFNWGLHDLRRMFDGLPQVDVATYRRNLERLVGRLEETRASLIWASTTPVPAVPVTPQSVPSDVPRYNEAAIEVMARRSMTVNDLYSYAVPRLNKLQRAGDVHFTAEGSLALARVVARAIRRTLP